jgi:hypothetical protein
MSGGSSADAIANSMSVVSLDTAGNSENPLTQLLADVYGYKTNGEDGVLRYHEFKAKLPNVFNFNREVGCIFTTKFNAKEMGEFVDEMYLSYLIVFKENPSQLNAKTGKELNDALFDPQNQYMWFKAYILTPNLKYNGFYGFPLDLGVKPLAEIWLKR